MTRRIVVRLLLTALLPAVTFVDAQQAPKVYRIGYLDPSNASTTTALRDAFRQQMRKLGWIEGKNIAIEYRFAELKAERMPELAADLVRWKADVIVAAGGAPGAARKVARFPS
jgi:putative ABC transport system substrate-binding protein